MTAFLKIFGGKHHLRGRGYLSKGTKLAQEEFRLEIYKRFSNIMRF